MVYTSRPHCMCALKEQHIGNLGSTSVRTSYAHVAE
jgi:hypothetical protein